MNRFIFKIATVATAALFAGGMAIAQQQMGGPPMGQTQSPTETQSPNAGMNRMGQMPGQESSMQKMEDRDFVHEALQGGMAQVKLGQLAAQKGATAAVRQLGEKMVNDHTQLDNNMRQVAANMEMHAPKKMSKKDKKLYAKLSTLSGKRFDQAYLKAMLKADKNDLKNFRREANDSQNPQVKQVASQGEQVISEHLQTIKSIAMNDGVSS